MSGLGDLGQTFEAHKVPILAAAGAGVVALALLRKRQAGGSAPAAAAPSSAGVYSAGGQTAGMHGAGYFDSSASDVYGLVQPQLESLQGQLGQLNTKLGSVPVSKAPASPIASTLASPRYGGSYAKVGSGMGEIEDDGSLLIFTGEQWAQASKGGPGSFTLTDLGPNNLPNMFTSAGNILAKNKALSSPSSSTTS